MKKMIFGAVFLAASSLSYAQIQLEHWLKAPQELSVYSPTGGTTNVSVYTGAVAGSRGYNSVYENGNPLVYIAGGKVYGVKNGVNIYLGSLDNSGYGISGNEYGIIPHPDNNTNICTSKKYFIIYSAKSGSGSNGATLAALVDMNTSTGGTSFTQIVYNFSSDNDVADIAMAISKLRNGNDRMIYMQCNPATQSGLKIFKLTSAGVFQAMTHVAVTVPRTREMELNNLGNALAYTDAAGNIKVYSISSATGAPSSSTPLLSIAATNSKGLEFDNTGTKLYYSDDNGIRVKTLTGTQALNSVTNLYAGSALEKSFSDVNHPTQIICGNSTATQGIDMTTNSLTMWNAAFNATFMPDQIDGEYANASLFNISGGYHICNGTASSLAFFGSPALVGLATVQVRYGGASGTVIGTFPFTNGGTFALPAQNTAVTYSASIYLNSAPTCTIVKNWTVYTTTCMETYEPVVTLVPHTSYYGLSIQPNDGTPITGSAWYVSELNAETNEGKFSINNPPVWQIGTTATNTFNGFFPTEEGNYTGQIADIPYSAEEGKFLYNHTYKITRETWIGSDPHEFYTVIVRNGEVISPEGSMEARSAISTATSESTPAVSISPNPGTGIFTIELVNGSNDAAIEIYSQLGALVKSFDQAAATAEMNLTGLPKGIYMVKILSGGTLTTKKLVLE